MAKSKSGLSLEVKTDDSTVKKTEMVWTKEFQMKASCTWGMGPDILMTIKRKPDPMRISSVDYFGLTVAQAEDLIKQLSKAAKRVEDLEASADEYFDSLP